MKEGFNSEDTTKLNDVVFALSQIGITATDSLGQLRPFADVVDELGAKFNTLSKNEQAYIATTLFGTYQRNRGLTLLLNYNDSLKNYENALNAAGTAEQKFNIYQESTQAYLARFKATWEGLWQTLIDSNAIKNVIDIGTTLLDIFTNLSNIIALTKGLDAIYEILKGVSSVISIISIGLEKFAKVFELVTTIISKSNATINIITTLGTLLSKINPVVDKFDNVIKDSGKNIEELNKNITNANNSFQGTEDTFQYLNVNVDEFNTLIKDGISNLTSLSDAYQTLNSGESLSIDNLTSLVSKYPTLAKYLAQTNDLTFQRGEILKQVWEIEKKTETARLTAQNELLQKQYNENIKHLSTKDWLAYNAGIDNDTNKAIKDQINTNRALLEIYNTEITNFNDKAKSGTKTDIYTAEINQFQAYEDALADINIQLERNDALQKLANNDDKIALLSKRVELLKQEQKALHDIAEARRQTISQNISKLQSQGFDVSYDAATNQLAISNWQHINDLKGKNIEATNKLRKSTEDLLQNTVKLNEANQDASKEWYSVEGVINDTNNSIAEINKSIAETITNTVKSQVSDLKQGLEQIMNAEEEAHQKRLDNIEEEKKKFDDYMDDKIEQLDREKAASDYSDDVNEITNELNKLQTERAKYSMAVASGDTEAISIVADLDEQISEKKKQLSEKQEDREYDLRKQSLQDQKEAYDDDLEAKKDREDKKYDAVKASYDKLLNDISTFTDSTTVLNTSMVDSMIQDYNNLSSQFAGITQQMANVFQNTFLSKLSNTRQEIQNLTGLSGNDTSSIISQMKSNSIAWGKASPEDKKRLADENMGLGTSMGWKRDPQSGIWYKADGTRAYGNGTDDVISLVGEHGRELKTLNPNGKDSIIPNGLTERLVSLANNPMNFMSKFMSNINIPTLSPAGGGFNMGNIVLNINGSINDQNIQRVNDNITTQLKSVFTKAGIISR
jgi:hypothetical protein